MILPVRNLSPRLLRGRRGDLLDALIDSPAPGGTSASWAVRVRGHLLASDGPPRAIEAVVPGQVLASAKPDLPTPEVALRHPSVAGAAACGFTLLLDTLGLPRQFEIRLRAELTDGSRIKIAQITGERQPLRGSFAATLQPLLVTSLGRMGTTLLMRMLASHQGIVVYDRPPYEVRGGKYWMHVLKTLASPADTTKRIGAPMEFHQEPLAVGGNPFYSAGFTAWRQVETWSGSAYIEDLATFCQRSIDGWYRATATAQGEDGAHLVYFAEKHFPDDYPRRLRELYPGAREIFLVRDFRDMIASMRAYNARKGFGDFGRATAVNDRAWLADLSRGVAALRDAWHERGEPGTLVRYEDLVREPVATLTPLLATLGLDASSSTVTQLVAAAAHDSLALHGHGTTATPESSIGRWRHDLPADLQVVAVELFGALLSEFGYE
jgi:hypothetical protein